jgi:rhodanese-related sulfurtransferase
LPIDSFATYPDVDVPMISAPELAADDAAYLVDLRPPDHFRRGHVAGSVNIDLETLHEAVDRLPGDRHIVLIDHKGKLTLTVGRFLASRGLTRVSRLDGGFNAWVKSGLAIRQSRAEVSVSAAADGSLP